MAASIIAWFEHAGRDLPWRAGRTDPWGILVCEVMSQQTPVTRVEPRWRAWMERWPTPADLAAAPRAEVLRAWDRLGYPRRAIRLHECAEVIVRDYDGEVPTDEETLRTLPGIGAYTAAAVAAFGGGHRTVVADTNVRRVLARLHGEAGVPAHVRAFELERARALLPQDPARAVRLNEGLMELGALICTARSPRCEVCPVAERCAWYAAGRPADPTITRRTQAWHGTDRQARGRIMALLRSPQADAGVSIDAARAASRAPAEQAERALAGLLADGLCTQTSSGLIRLP